MALSNREGWRYFDADDQATALLALRARMGDSFATDPDDAALTILIERMVRFLERATKRFFVKREGVLRLRGSGEPRLWLPFPIVATDQGGTGLVSVTFFDDSEPQTIEDFTVNDGAWEGDDDPRDDPFIEYAIDTFGSQFVSRPPVFAGSLRHFPYGVKNIIVDASWGYLEPDGAVPELILHVLARLCVLNVDPNDDLCAVDDRRRGALIAESTRGRSYQVAAHAVSGGITLDREIDQILRSYKRPPTVTVSRPPARRGRARFRE